MEYGFIRPESLWSKKSKVCRYVLVVVDNFSESNWTVPLKNKKAPAITDLFENMLKSSKSLPISFEIDDGNDFAEKTFTDFLRKNSIERNNRYTSEGAVFAKQLK